MQILCEKHARHVEYFKNCPECHVLYMSDKPLVPFEDTVISYMQNKEVTKNGSTMIILKNDNPHAVDVDYTLVYPVVNIPFDTEFSTQQTVMIDGVQFLKNISIIDEMRIAKARGQQVKVWSAGGWEWALKVVQALQLEDIVDVVCAKDRWTWDDKEPSEWTQRCFRGFFDHKEDK